VSEIEVQAVVTAWSSQDMPERDRLMDTKVARMMVDGTLTMVDVIRGPLEAGSRDVASNIVEMQRRRLASDWCSCIYKRHGRSIRIVHQPSYACCQRGNGMETDPIRSKTCPKCRTYLTSGSI
jgi:propanediol dehydratase large subunit